MDYSDANRTGAKRVFIQDGGPGPANALKYTGIDSQYLGFTGGKRSVRGGVDPIFILDPLVANEYALVGTKNTPPTLPAGAITLYEKRGTLPFSFSDLLCPLNLYLVNGLCTDLSAFDTGWSGYLEIWGDGKATDIDLGDRSVLDSDDVLKDTINYVFRRSYAVGSMILGQQSAAVTVHEVIDVAMAPNTLCADCGASNDGSKWQYAIHKENSGVTAASALYSTDYGVTWTQQTITGMANTETPTAINVVGNLLVVLSSTGAGANQSAFYYSPINQTTGVPSSTWTKVSTGFDSAGGHLSRDFFVLSSREVFVVSDGGYIYKSTDITAGVTLVSAGGATTVNLTHVYGLGEVVAACGATGKVVVSLNRGATWGLTTSDPSANTLNTIAIRAALEFWVGDANGGVFYTLDGGTTWSSKAMPATLAAVQDILWVTPEVGYLTATIAGPLGRIITTVNGGQTWIISSNTQPRLLNAPSTTQRYNRIAAPMSAGLTRRANVVTFVGLGAATAGMIVTARANEV